ncbi:hypothetical protein TWF694_005183 [Orbilia ellipsospora]|uniref:DUF1996 domain-containing protein n=1 Tax=Orbilia ellipsospora TaxID=2528407 RepID=A0AAV9WXD1_9PEZI
MKVSTIIATLASAASLTLTEAASRKPSRTFGTVQFGGDKELTRCRLDPIVNPGVTAAHMHSVFGGSNFGASMPGDYATKASCTTANVKNDHSNYWVPSLYFRSPENGTLYPVELFYAKVYYFFEATNDYIKPFPPGFRMLAGDSSLRAPPNPVHDNLDASKGAITPVQWTCPRSDDSTPLYEPTSDGTKGVGVQDPSNGGQGWGFPDKECDGYASPLRADIHFPSCVKEDADPTDYKTNTCYPSSNGMGGEDCPAGYIHVPHVFMEVYWNTLKYKDWWPQKGQGKQPWVLSNGDTTGYSLHADFINGWDTETLQYAIDNCDPGNGGLHTCAGLPGGSTSEDEMNSCKVTCPLAEGSSDNYYQPMPNNKLFGNNPLSGYSATKYVAPGGSSPAPVESAKPASVKPVATTTKSPAPVIYKSTTMRVVTTTKKAATTKAAAPKTTSAPVYQVQSVSKSPKEEHTTTVLATNIHTAVKTVYVNGGPPPPAYTAKPVKKPAKTPAPAPVKSPKETCSRKKTAKHHRTHRKHHNRAISGNSF